jgi:hypothetical protein
MNPYAYEPADEPSGPVIRPYNWREWLGVVAGLLGLLTMLVLLLFAPWSLLDLLGFIDLPDWFCLLRLWSLRCLSLSCLGITFALAVMGK